MIGIGIGVGYAQYSQSNIIFFDDCNRPDNPSSVGNGWLFFARTSTPSSLMGILNGQVYVSQNPTFEVTSYRDSALGSTGNIAVSCVFPTTDLTSCLIARCNVPYNDQQSFYMIGFDNVDSPALYKVSGGSYTKLGGSSLGAAIPNGSTARLEIRGTSIRAYINGNQFASAVDSTPITAGPGVGMRNGNNSSGHWDNFVVERL